MSHFWSCLTCRIRTFGHIVSVEPQFFSHSFLYRAIPSIPFFRTSPPDHTEPIPWSPCSPYRLVIIRIARESCLESGIVNRLPLKRSCSVSCTTTAEEDMSILRLPPNVLYDVFVALQVSIHHPETTLKPMPSLRYDWIPEL